nr:CU044_5270 family protein [Streptomyces sp. NBC_00995]
MNTPIGFKQRLGAELALLERERAEQAAEEASGQDIPVTARRVLARPGARRTALMGLAAGTVAVTLVATSGSDGARPRPVRAMTVAQVLDAAADHAEKGTAKEPGLHQWVYTDTVVCWEDCSHRPSWYRYDGVKGATLSTTPSTGKRTMIVVRDVAQDLSAGEVGAMPRDTRDVLSRLPTEPRKLLERVSADPFFATLVDPSVPPRHGPKGTISTYVLEQSPAVTPGARFARILNILKSVSNIPPRTNAALYRALALIPGAELVSTPRRDAAGRPGLTIRFDFHDPAHTREYLFLDPRTYAYRGTRTDRQGMDSFSDSYARVATGIVDHPGQVPGGPAPDPSTVVVEPPVFVVDLRKTPRP